MKKNAESKYNKSKQNWESRISIANKKEQRITIYELLCLQVMWAKPIRPLDMLFFFF